MLTSRSEAVRMLRELELWMIPDIAFPRHTASAASSSKVVAVHAC
jgi:hypothetical protein